MPENFHFIDGSLIDGVEDLGNFNEGFCFRLNLKTFLIWNLCADSNVDKLFIFVYISLFKE